MPLNDQALVDERGYIFMFPKLGLPDPNDAMGQDVSIRAAIGTSNDVPLINDHTRAAPRRYAGGIAHESFDLEYAGAVWILPLLAPKQPSTKAELFTIKARRLHPSRVPDPRRYKLEHGSPILLMQPPPGKYPWQTATPPTAQQRGKSLATKQDEKKWWKDSGVMDHLTRETRTKVLRSEHRGDITMYAYRVDPRTNKPTNAVEEGINPQDAINEVWEKGIKAEAIINVVNAIGVMPRSKPFLWLRGTATPDSVDIEYHISWCDGKGPHPKENEWKTVPPYGYKDGYELAITNQVRKSMGQSPLTEERLESSRWKRRVKV